MDGLRPRRYNFAGKGERLGFDATFRWAARGCGGAPGPQTVRTGIMLGRVLSLFRQYAREHVTLASDGFALIDDEGRRFGRVERIGLVRNRIVVEGWTCAPWVTLCVQGNRQTIAPGLHRTDVDPDFRDRTVATPGFRVDVPHAPGPVKIWFDLDGRPRTYVIDPFPVMARRWAALRLVPGYVVALVRGIPAYLRWRVDGDPAERARIKQLLGFDRAGDAPAMDPRLLAGDRVLAPAVAQPALTIVLPVHNARTVLAEALDRVARHTDLPWHLVVIEDGSTDPEVRPFLRDWVAGRPPGQVDLIENAANLGFIRSANLGLARAVARADHVVLLNSDALVPRNWASRLLRPILEEPEHVASVTPMSNDAEILSVPMIARRGALEPGVADRMDALAVTFHPDAARVTVPTGIGFCMAMNIRHLRHLPAFDTTLGRGYGEEVDWCQKVRGLGGRHVAIANLFVEHRGAMSFGSLEKRRLVARNNAIISSRYPAYDAEVQTFMQGDPLVTARLALAIAWAAARSDDRATPLYLGHALGGGAEDYLAARVARDLDPARGGLPAALVLRVGTALRWRLELHSPLGVTMGATDDFALIAALLRPLPRLRIVYSCGVGDRDPIELPDRLLSLRRGPQDTAEALFHDYLPISPSYTLLDSDGFHRGLPTPDTTDRAHRALRPDGSVADNGAWRAAWGRYLAACETIVTFSNNSQRLAAAAFPEARNSIVVEPHAMLVDLPRVTPPAVRARPVIGVLGNIGQQKGARVLSDLSFSLAKSGVADLVLVGNIDPGFALAPQTTVHGSYARRDIPDLIARYGISCWLMPSIWPETFSYTTHECIATGLPVWCFDLGAQADAVRATVAATGRGGIIPLHDGRPQVEDLIRRVTQADGHRAGSA